MLQLNCLLFAYLWDWYVVDLLTALSPAACFVTFEAGETHAPVHLLEEIGNGTCIPFKLQICL